MLLLPLPWAVQVVVLHEYAGYGGLDHHHSNVLLVLLLLLINGDLESICLAGVRKKVLSQSVYIRNSRYIK